MNGKIVKEWIKKAEQDRVSAKALLSRRKLSVNDVICFHCQQSVEKYLKAFLTSVNSEFSKTHDLLDLLDVVLKKDSSFELIRDLIKPLNKFAVRFRYPGEEARRPQAKHAIQVMEETKKFITDRMK